MAAGRIAGPGTQYGPCLDECKHIDCAQTRTMAEKVCRLCDKPIGYEADFYRDPEDEANQLVHAPCLEDFSDRQRAAYQNQPV